MSDGSDLSPRYDELSAIATRLGRLLDAIGASTRTYGDAPLDKEALRARLALESERIAERRLRLGFTGDAASGMGDLVAALRAEAELAGLLEVVDLPGANAAVRKLDGVFVVTRAPQPLAESDALLLDADVPVFAVSTEEGLAELRRQIVEKARGELVSGKLASVGRRLASVSRELATALGPRWEKAEKEGGRSAHGKVVAALKHLARVRDGFRLSSARFRKEQVLRKSFEKVLEQATARINERIKLHLAGCNEAALRQEHEAAGAAREPKELLRSFRERAQAAILEDAARIVWDRPSDAPPAAGGVPAPLLAEHLGLLRKHVHDAYCSAIGKGELLAAVTGLLPNDPAERAAFARILDELELALEVTTDSLFARETLELSEPMDSLAQGAAGFPDWAKRYQQGLGQVLTDKLQRSLRSMQGYLWSLYWKHLLKAEQRVLAFLESDEVVGLITLNVEDIRIPLDASGSQAVSPRLLAEHSAEWKRIDALLTSFARTL